MRTTNDDISGLDGDITKNEFNLTANGNSNHDKNQVPDDQLVNDEDFNKILSCEADPSHVATGLSKDQIKPQEQQSKSNNLFPIIQNVNYQGSTPIRVSGQATFYPAQSGLIQNITKKEQTANFPVSNQANYSPSMGFVYQQPYSHLNMSNSAVPQPLVYQLSNQNVFYNPSGPLPNQSIQSNCYQTVVPVNYVPIPMSTLR